MTLLVQYNNIIYSYSTKAYDVQQILKLIIQMTRDTMCSRLPPIGLKKSPVQ